MSKGIFQDEVDVLKFQRNRLIDLDRSYCNINNDLDEIEKRLQELIQSNNIDSTKLNNIVRDKNVGTTSQNITLKEHNNSFDDLLRRVFSKCS